MSRRVQFQQHEIGPLARGLRKRHEAGESIPDMARSIGQTCGFVYGMLRGQGVEVDPPERNSVVCALTGGCSEDKEGVKDCAGS
ncbi:helix-turn-helix domain-containing protein [Amycolatopsis lurida]